MADYLKESRNLMPGRARLNWRLNTEEKKCIEGLCEGTQQESIVGAPGAFAVSDAPEAADLLDRVHSPRWEYPSWVLPTVQLDEGDIPSDNKLRAMLWKRVGASNRGGKKANKTREIMLFGRFGKAFGATGPETSRTLNIDTADRETLIRAAKAYELI